MTTAILLAPKNYQYIALRTANASVQDLQLAYETSPPNTRFYVVKDYVGLDGTVFADWTLLSEEWLDTYYKFDSYEIAKKSETQFVPVTKRVKPKVAV